MQDSQISNVIKILQKELAVGTMPIVSHLAADQRNPFVILISTLLSLRTKDEVTAVAAERLLEIAATPEEMVGIPLTKIEKAIYPVGFYHVKARTIHSCLPGVNTRDLTPKFPLILMICSVLKG